MTDTERLARLSDLADHADFIRNERDNEIRHQHTNGTGVAELTRITGLTRQRIYQILDNERTT